MRNKVAPILESYFADALGKIPPYENRDIFFHKRLPAIKAGVAWMQKVAHSSQLPKIIISKSNKSTAKEELLFFIKACDMFWISKNVPEWSC